jgi:phenylalanyl-tRNA synthetase beta subunit
MMGNKKQNERLVLVLNRVTYLLLCIKKGEPQSNTREKPPKTNQSVKTKPNPLPITLSVGYI